MRGITIKLWEKIQKADTILLDLLYPPRCPVCDGVADSKARICQKCRKKVQQVKEPSCMKCGKPLSDMRKEFCLDCDRKKHNFSQGKAVWVYENEIKKSIYRFKYQNKREYGRVYAEEIAARYGQWIKSKQIQVIVPVPLHKKRKRKRGYNQAEVLAKELGRILGLPVDTELLVRVRDTSPQKILNDAERKNNLKKAFKTTKSVVQLQYILVVDDIYTTGSTVDAVAKILLEAGVLEVYTCCISIGKGY